jgi:sulfhydrogenase subunit beta (sulfur reductase)
MIAKDQLRAVLAEWMGEYRLLAPVQRQGELCFAQVASPAEVVLDYRNTGKAPKGTFFPQSERMLRFAQQLDHFNELQEVPLDATPTILLGVRPCDARSFALLDRIFIGGQYLDPYYSARRENTLIISLACDHPRPTCFCNAFGSSPYDRTGADLFWREAGDAYLLEVVTERGGALLAGLTLPMADSAHLAEAAAIEARAQARMSANEPVAGIETELATLFDSPVWATIAEKCLACGTCTYVCPECHCFNIEDRLLAHGGERIRGWDSCMYSTFTQHASGHNPRPDQGARWRQRTMHKFEYLPRNVALYGCVGCGRCILSCPVRLDIREVLRRVRAAYGEKNAAKVGTGA